MPTPKIPQRVTRVRQHSGLYLVLRRGQSHSRLQPLADPEAPSILVRTSDLYETTCLPDNESPELQAPTPDPQPDPQSLSPNPQPDPERSFRSKPRHRLPDALAILDLTPTPAQAKRARFARIEELLLANTASGDIQEIIVEEFGVSPTTAQKDVSYAAQRLLELALRDHQTLRAESSARLVRIASSPTSDPKARLAAESQYRELHGLDAPNPNPTLSHHILHPGLPHPNNPYPLAPSSSPLQHLAGNPDLIQQIADVESQLAQSLGSQVPAPGPPNSDSPTPEPESPEPHEP